MKSFDNIRNLHLYLEDNALKLTKENIIGIFKDFRDLKKFKEEIEESKKAQFEMDFFSFEIINGNLIPKYPYTDKDGVFKYYVSLETFDDDTYQYLIERWEFTSNPFLKAIYSTILWHGKKHGKYSKAAVDSFLELINFYKEKTEYNENWFNTATSIINSYCIAFRTGYKLDDLKLELIKTIKTYETFNNILIAPNLIYWMWEQRKKFNNADFEGIPDICWELSSKIELINSHFLINIVNIGEKIEQKLNTKKYAWAEKKALLYEKLLQENENENKFTAVEYCLEAIKNYNLIEDEKKVLELEKKYEELNEKVEFNKVSYTIEDANDTLNKIREIASNIVKENDPNQIIDILMADDGLIIPDYEYIVELTTGINETFPLSALLPKTVIDGRGHPAQHFKKDVEKKRHDIIFYYIFSLRMVQEPLVHSIIIEAYAKEKFSAYILLKYLKNHSWIGTRWPHEEKNTENWLAMISPAIINYFDEIKTYGITSSFILSIDSLVLKLEGILRDLCLLIGDDIITSKTEYRNGLIKQEKNINDILYDEKIEKIIPKNNLEYLKIILIEQSGYNLRNEIAHSLLQYQSYGISRMNHLLIALLRLCNYNIFIEEKNTEDHD